MTLNRVKLGHAITFMKYLASLISLTFLIKTLTCNKITFRLSNSLYLACNLASYEEYVQKFLPIFLFSSYLLMVIVKISRTSN